MAKNKQKQPKPRSVRWTRVIMWAFLGWLYTISGLTVSGYSNGIWFVLAEVIALLVGLMRFIIELNILKHPVKPKEERVREYQIVGLSFVGYLLATITIETLTDGDLNPIMALFTLPIIAIFVYLGITWQLHRPRVVAEPSVAERPMSKKLAEHYEDAGMSDSEVVVFRETMAGASKNVHQLEKTVQNTVELQDILREFDTMNVIHAYFKAIVNEPKRMTEAAPFLYEQLPNMADLTRKYQIITRHEVKTSDTYLVLNQAKDALAKLAAKIRDEYATFVRDDLEDLDSTVTLAKQQLARYTESDASTTDSAEKEDN